MIKSLKRKKISTQTKIALVLLLCFFKNDLFSQKKAFITLNEKPCSKCICQLISNDSTIYTTKTLKENGVLLLSKQEINSIKEIRIETPSKKNYVFSNLKKRFKNKNSVLFECDKQEVLKEVIINSKKKQVIEDDGDKLIYNVPKSDIENTTNATELLRRTPLVSLGSGGNPTVRGKNVRVLINGKEKTGLSSSQVLNQIPSSSIVKIEIITSPSVKYDAEGASGIINIITKKKINLKTSGDLGAGLGITGSHLYTNHNYKIDNSQNLSASFSSLIYYPKLASKFTIRNKKEVLLNSTSEGNNNGLTTYFSLNYSKHKKNRTTDLFFNHYFFNDKVNQSFNNELSTNVANKYNYYQFKIDNSFTFKNFNKLQFSYSTSFLPVKNSFNIFSTTLENTSDINNHTFSTDYNFRFNRKLKGSMGAKIDFDFIKGNNISNQSSVNHFNVNKLLSSFYSELNYKVNNFSKWRFGLRHEGYFVFNNGSQIQEINSLFYSLGYNRKFSAKSSLSINLSQRIERPTLNSLLPITNSSNSFVSNQGNPNLKAGNFNLLEIGFSNYFGNTFFKVSPFLSIHNNKISSFLTFNNNLNNFTASPVNANRSYDYGTNIWLTTKVFKKKVSVNYGIDLIFKKIKYKNQENSGFQHINKVNLSYDITKKLQMNFFGSFISEDILIQGFKNSYTYSNFSIKNKFSKNFSLSISVDNPFRSGYTARETFELPTIIYSSEQTFFDRGFRVFFNYKFGKQKNKLNNNINRRANLLD